MLFVFLVGFILVLAGASGSHLDPNIVILLVDDLGFNDVGFHGSPEILTPTINSLAQRGTILTRHYAMPVCELKWSKNHWMYPPTHTHVLRWCLKLNLKLIADSRGINIFALIVGCGLKKNPGSQYKGRKTIVDNII